jgi:hypothetical protein
VALVADPAAGEELGWHGAAGAGDGGLGQADEVEDR